MINASLVNNLSGKIGSEKSHSLEPSDSKELSLTEHESEPEDFASLVNHQYPDQLSTGQPSTGQISSGQLRTAQINTSQLITDQLTTDQRSTDPHASQNARTDSSDAVMAQATIANAMTTNESMFLQTKMLTLASQDSLTNQSFIEQPIKESTIQNQMGGMQLETQLPADLASLQSQAAQSQYAQSQDANSQTLDLNAPQSMTINPVGDPDIFANQRELYNNIPTTPLQETMRNEAMVTEAIKSQAMQSQLLHGQTAHTHLNILGQQQADFVNANKQETSATRISLNELNELFNNDKKPLSGLRTSINVTQLSQTFNTETSQMTTLTNSTLNISSQAQDFVFFDESKTEFTAASRFTAFSATEQPFVANWQSQPVMTESKDASIIQITDTASDKVKVTYGNSSNTIFGANNIEQQKEIQLKQIVNNLNYSEVKIKDSKLGDIHFSVSGKQKEHLGVFVTQSQTQNIIQTHFHEIQQELTEEGVTDFEMFSSKDEQEQQKREYLAQQSKSFAQIQDDLEAVDLPNIKANLVSHYSPSSINITA